jgi:hypothetical protein
VGELSDLLEEFDGGYEPDDSCVDKTSPRYLAGKRAADLEARVRMRAAFTIHDGIFRRLPLPHYPRSKQQ